MFKMGSHDPFGYLNTNYGQKKGRESNDQFDSRPLKIGNPLISLCVGGVPHTIGKLLMRVTILLQTHINWRFAHKVMSLQSGGSPSFGNFRTPTWESRDKNDIWVLVPWPGTKYTIRGKVMASPKSRLWWVLWICVCSWLIRAPKML